MLGASRIGDPSICTSCGAVGPADVASGNVQSNALGALCMGDRGLYPRCCDKQSPVKWIASTGAATVWINKEPAVALSHTTTRVGGRGAMLEGSANVFVGGASISMEEMGRADALAMIDKGLRSLDRWNAEDRRRFREWFGTDSEEARQRMREHMLKMRDKLLREELVVGSEEGPYAHVFPWGNTVNLDGRFWTAPRTGEDSRAGTIVHETSHFSDAGGTKDHAYGRSACRTLANTDPAKAQNNADSHEYWLETLP